MMGLVALVVPTSARQDMGKGIQKSVFSKCIYQQDGFINLTLHLQRAGILVLLLVGCKPAVHSTEKEEDDKHSPVYLLNTGEN